jgi:hypothetical protein
MFQYAAGRCLAHLHTTELKLDLSYLNADPKGKYTKREYKLDLFNISSQIAEESDLKRFFPLERGKITRTLMRKLPILFSKLIANESGFNFHKEFYSYPKHVYLNGFWQSELYFEPVKDILVKEFTLKNNLNEQNLSLVHKIKNCNSVSLHIRRGDYVNRKESKDLHGNCSLDYYQSAINYLKSKNENIQLFVFSDDLAWVKENLKTNVQINYVDFNNPGEIDMYLMSICKHNIIANSSFSWWGAWLNQNPGKTVIAPMQWFADPHTSTPDIYPENWVKI